jgi:hypothetical protein
MVGILIYLSSERYGLRTTFLRCSTWDPDEGSTQTHSTLAGRHRYQHHNKTAYYLTTPEDTFSPTISSRTFMGKLSRFGAPPGFAVPNRHHCPPGSTFPFGKLACVVQNGVWGATDDIRHQPRVVTAGWPRKSRRGHRLGVVT